MSSSRSSRIGHSSGRSLVWWRLADGGLSNEVLLQRLSALYSEAFVSGVAAELEEARTLASESDDGGAGGGKNTRVAEIHARFTYRMHDLSQFMKGLLIRFTRWFNRTHSRTGTLWSLRDLRNGI